VGSAGGTVVLSDGARPEAVVVADRGLLAWGLGGDRRSLLLLLRPWAIGHSGGSDRRIKSLAGCAGGEVQRQERKPLLCKHREPRLREDDTRSRTGVLAQKHMQAAQATGGTGLDLDRHRSRDTIEAEVSKSQGSFDCQLRITQGFIRLASLEGNPC